MGAVENQRSTMPDNSEEHSIEPNDEEFQVHNESRSWKVGSSDASSDALQNTDKTLEEDKMRLYCWCRRKHETKARRSWTQTSSLQKGEIVSLITVLFTNSFRCFKHFRCKVAVEKDWQKLENISAWQLTKVRNKKEVIDEARTKGAKVHFISLMDFSHLKNAEMEAKHQKYKGRIVFRGDIV